MNAAPEGNLATIGRLRAALEETAAALAGADLDRLLAADTTLQAALSALPSLASAPSGDRSHLRRELEGASAALLRCRRLGAGLSDFVRLSLDAHGGQLGYHAEGTRASAAALAGRGFSRKV